MCSEPSTFLALLLLLLFAFFLFLKMYLCALLIAISNFMIHVFLSLIASIYGSEDRPQGCTHVKHAFYHQPALSPLTHYFFFMVSLLSSA